MFVFVITFPVVAYQPNSGMTVSAAFMADIGCWLRRMGRTRTLSVKKKKTSMKFPLINSLQSINKSECVWYRDHHING